jgi:hypothetical protein
MLFLEHEKPIGKNEYFVDEEQPFCQWIPKALFLSKKTKLG